MGVFCFRQSTVNVLHRPWVIDVIVRFARFIKTSGQPLATAIGRERYNTFAERSQNATRFIRATEPLTGMDVL
jgi:hypothetical protein